MIRSVSPLQYNLGSLYLVHTLIREGTFQPGMHHLTMTSFSWSTDLDKLMLKDTKHYKYKFVSDSRLSRTIFLLYSLLISSQHHIVYMYMYIYFDIFLNENVSYFYAFIFVVRFCYKKIVRAKTGWLRIRIMFPSGVTCLPT